jgi:hypothetical protein
MEDICSYGREEDEQSRRYDREDDHRTERTAAGNDDEVPFHIPRD